MIITGPAF